MNAKATGSAWFEIDGKRESVSFVALSYATFSLAQSLVTGLDAEMSTYALRQCLGYDDGRFSGAPTGNVAYGYSVDFEGTPANSNGGHTWSGLPADQAEYFATKLRAAQAILAAG